jgi:hypothetical protein
MTILLKHYFSSTKRLLCDIELEVRGGCHPPNSLGKRIGQFAFLGDHCIALFSVDFELFVLVNSEVRKAPPESFYSRNGEIRELVLVFGSDRRTIKYWSERVPVSTVFYSEDEEDADFGLWIHNVLSSSERRKRCIESWVGGMKS